MTNSMRVKAKKSFLSPLTNRLVKVGAEFNVPKNQFWFKREKLEDIEVLKRDIENQKAKAEPKAVVDKPKKGSR